MQGMLKERLNAWNVGKWELEYIKTKLKECSRLSNVGEYLNHSCPFSSMTRTKNTKDQHNDDIIIVRLRLKL